MRGVDLFGRVSAASSWDVGKVEDVAPPPAPVLVQAEWVQRALPAMTVAVMGRSVEAQRWLTKFRQRDSTARRRSRRSLGDAADGRRCAMTSTASVFSCVRLHRAQVLRWARRSNTNPGPRMSRSSVRSRSSGAAASFPSRPDPQIAVTLTAGESVPEGPRSPTAPVNPPVPRIAYRTNLALDGASNLFVDGTLTIGTRVLTVVANGDGPNLIVVVEHPAGSPPPLAGAATLRAAADKLVSFETDVADLVSPTGLSVRSGLLLDEQATPARFPVLRKSSDEFLCAKPPDPTGVPTVAPAPGHVVAWHPVWLASLSDSGFGPVANATTPVANAQVAVQAVRLLQTLGLSSARSATLTVTAVDVAPPPTPTITALPF